MKRGREGGSQRGDPRAMTKYREIKKGEVKIAVTEHTAGRARAGAGTERERRPWLSPGYLIKIPLVHKGQIRIYSILGHVLYYRVCRPIYPSEYSRP